MDLAPIGEGELVASCVDAHQHFWRVGQFEATWMMGSGFEVLQQDYLPVNLEPLLQTNSIAKTVLVQTVHSLPETKWFLELAHLNPFIAGVVGWVPLEDPRVGDLLDTLRQDRAFVGVRHVVHDEPDIDWLLRPAVWRGLRELESRGLPYDLLLRPPHLAAALRVADAFPSLPLVVDHMAKPRIAQSGWDDWAGGVKDLSRRPNVSCKLSGMITEADWRRWKPQDLRPYIAHVLECFGTERVMFGSDWPVCLLAGSYGQVVHALASNLAHLSTTERANLFRSNAIRFYRLS